MRSQIELRRQTHVRPFQDVRIGGCWDRVARPDRRATSSIRIVAEARIEALLFLAAEPLNAKEIAERLNLGPAAVDSACANLAKTLAAENSAFRLDRIAGGYQLRTHAEVTPWLLRRRIVADHRLPAALAETLAVIVRNQPITRADVDAIRGVSCADAIKQLLAKKLIRPAGRHPSLGRPQLYATTKRFLQFVGLDSLQEWPEEANL